MRGTKLLATLMLCLCLGWATGCAGTKGGDGSEGSQAGKAGETADSAVGEGIEASDPLDGITASSRVVALSRSLGDMWLLAGGQLVGITEDGLTLQGIAEDVESIGTVTEPDLQAVIDLEPDLVLLTKDIPAHQELLPSLSQAGVPALVVDINSFDDYAQVMATFTETTGRDDLYEKNVSKVQAQIDNIVQNAAATEESSYLVLRVSASSSKLLGPDSFVCNMLDQMGLANAVPGGESQANVTPEEIAKINPDRLFVVLQGSEEQARKAFEETFMADPSWSELTAAKNARVVVLPKTLFQYKPNAKWGEAYSYISQVLHGSWA